MRTAGLVLLFALVMLLRHTTGVFAEPNGPAGEAVPQSAAEAPAPISGLDQKLAQLRPAEVAAELAEGRPRHELWYYRRYYWDDWWWPYYPHWWGIGWGFCGPGVSWGIGAYHRVPRP